MPACGLCGHRIIAKPPFLPMKSFSSRFSRQRAGFTLIELLTVIAIIGILAAILIPTVGSVRERAKSIQCMSNVRQWGTSILLYSADNKNTYAVNTSASGSGAWWYQVGDNNAIYAPYFNTKKDYSSLSNCPTASNIGNASTIQSTCFVMGLPRFNGTPVPYNKIEITKARTPSSLILMTERAFTEATGAGILGMDYTSLHITANAATARLNAQGFTRHGGKMNTVFADGHTERLTYEGDDAKSAWNKSPSGTFNYIRWLTLDN